MVVSSVSCCKVPHLNSGAVLTKFEGLKKKKVTRLQWLLNSLFLVFYIFLWTPTLLVTNLVSRSQTNKIRKVFLYLY